MSSFAQDDGLMRVMGGNPATGPFYVEGAEPGEHMKSFSIPVRPMLGCVATAVNPASAPPPTGDEGGYGGNMGIVLKIKKRDLAKLGK